MSDAGGIAAIGECMLELSAADADQWRMAFAGDTFNTLWAMRALLPNARIDYVTAFGADPFSQRQIGFLRENGIGVAASPTLAGARPGLYAITLDGVERSFTYWRADSAARQLASDPVALAKSLSNLRLAYFSGITLAILDNDGRRTLLHSLREARAAGTLVAFDPNYRPRLWPSPSIAREAITEALAVADIALPTFPDEQELYGDETPDRTLDRLVQSGIREAVVKNGTGDALMLSDGLTSTVPAQRIDDAVDTTGAGDAFNGGYLAARMSGLGGPEAAACGHRTAAAVVRVRGALAPAQVLRKAFEG
ncbi:MAG: sugar kinase [Rhizobiaceae bacterium]